MCLALVECFVHALFCSFNERAVSFRAVLVDVAAVSLFARYPSFLDLFVAYF